MENQPNDPLDFLWDKVSEKMARLEEGPNPSDQDSFASAFDLASQELQRQSLLRLKSRFQKERSYWEDLLNNKEALVRELSQQITEEKQKYRELKLRVEELEDSRTDWVQKSFASIDMQKKALSIRTEQLEKALEENFAEISRLKINLESEKALFTQQEQVWQEREKNYLEERDRQQLQFQELEAEHYKTRQAELEEVSKLEDRIRQLQLKLEEQGNTLTQEKNDLHNLLLQKDARIEQLETDIATLKETIKKDKEDRRLAAIERERESIQEDEQKRRILEQVSLKEVKIRELETNLEKALGEHSRIEDDLKKRSEKMRSDEEFLIHRRENWVESIKNQSEKELQIAEKVLHMVSKIEDATLDAGAWFGGPKVRAPFEELAANKQPPVWKRLAQFGDWCRAHVWWTIILSASLTAGVSFVGWNGYRNHLRVADYLERGNVQFMRGDGETALLFFQKARALAPTNSETQNAVAMVLGNLVRSNMAAKNFKKALSYADQLSNLDSDNAEVLRLKGEILEGMNQYTKNLESRVDQLTRPASQVNVEKEEPVSTPEKNSRRSFPLEYNLDNPNSAFPPEE